MSHPDGLIAIKMCIRDRSVRVEDAGSWKALEKMGGHHVGERLTAKDEQAKIGQKLIAKLHVRQTQLGKRWGRNPHLDAAVRKGLHLG